MNIIASNRPFPGKVASSPSELDSFLEEIYYDVSDTIFFPFWSWQVPPHILKKYKCIGFHSAPLPSGKGGSPIQNMIRLGYPTTQLCMFRMTPELDNGEVLARLEVSLEGSLKEIINRITQEIATLINDYIERPDYSNVPDKFSRITDNFLSESDTTKKLYDEIRMRDEDGHPKAFIYHGKHRIEFTEAELKDGELIARARILQK